MESTKPHVVVIPFAAQGHVMPLMKLSHRLIDHGFRVTFVNTESIHSKLVDALPEKKNELASMNLVAIPDGLKPEDTLSTLLFAPPASMLAEFEKLITKLLETEEIACVIADETVGWAIEIAKKKGIRCASLLPSPAGVKALWYNIPKLIEMGVIEENGSIKLNKDETFILSPNMPPVNQKHLTWCYGGSVQQQKFFGVYHNNFKISSSLADWVLCNTSDHLEHEALSMVPNMLSIGPLIVNNQLGNFWQQDSACIEWLNQQPTNSVIYVANGSVAMLSQRQFHELAYALELLGRPFLWVVRSDGTSSQFPDGFEDRVAEIGKMVAWAPQMEVLAHPSTACFLSHCGWNSVLDAVSLGVPFITWPAFGDHYWDETLVTDAWKVGLGLDKDEAGIVSRDEIKKKVNQVLADEGIKENAIKLKEMVMIDVAKGGSSNKNLEKFVEEVKR